MLVLFSGPLALDNQPSLGSPPQASRQPQLLNKLQSPSLCPRLFPEAPVKVPCPPPGSLKSFPSALYSGLQRGFGTQAECGPCTLRCVWHSNQAWGCVLPHYLSTP